MTYHSRARHFLLLAAPCALASLLSSQQPVTTAFEFDLILRGGTVYDGTGAPGIRSDVGITAGRIRALGELSKRQARNSINLAGLCIAPGFIDTHAHAESGIIRRPEAQNFVFMGVTTIVSGNCGNSARDLGKSLQQIEKRRASVNYASLIGHNTVRRAVLGNEARAPNPKELAKMQELVDKGMRDGAMGLSTGLIYLPGTFAKTDELIALAKIVGQHQGLYASHMRNEGDRVLEAIDEALEIGTAAGIPVHLSHLKASGKNNWGRGKDILQKLLDARAAGHQVTGDQYAYTASSTGLDVLFPSRALSIGRPAFAKRLQEDATFRDEMHAALLKKLASTGFADFAYCQVSWAKNNDECSGMNLAQIAKRFFKQDDKNAQARAAIKLFADSKGSARVNMVYHKMSETDVVTIMRAPFISVACDAGIRKIKGISKPHPRGSGNNARVLGYFVRKKSALALPLAIQKMTSLPARVFGLKERGEIRPGFHADLTVFDANKVADMATYQSPRLQPAGIPLVLVNGVPVVRNGKHTGSRPGKVLRRTTKGTK
jgi:N-acyl-D-amino-acid deacylase